MTIATFALAAAAASSLSANAQSDSHGWLNNESVQTRYGTFEFKNGYPVGDGKRQVLRRLGTSGSTPMKNVISAALVCGSIVISQANAQAISKEKAYEIARDAYVYAYPIVTMDVSMRQSTNVPNAKTIPLRAPVNQFAHARNYPRAEDRDVVRYNFETLYSPAWLDLGAEPIVLTVPDTQGAIICFRCSTCGPMFSVSSVRAQPERRRAISRLWVRDGAERCRMG